MNTFLGVLQKHDIEKSSLRRRQLTTLQANLGNLCNQNCIHCHIEASPSGTSNMSKEVAEDIILFVSGYRIKTLDITGGAPELNPNFDYLISRSNPLVDELIVRSNLTVLFEKGKDYLPEFLKSNKVHLICSLPCYTKENVDSQRGTGVFDKSIRALKLLNDVGYGIELGLKLDLVYNPLGAYLPGPQKELEAAYKKVLWEEYGVVFNRLLTITNVAIKRFASYLDSNSSSLTYSNILQENFNPQTIDNLMCRNFLSIGFDGRLYDCDFNLALGLSLLDFEGEPLKINTLNPQSIEGREIVTGKHCFACTAGRGSSCQGELSGK